MKMVTRSPQISGPQMPLKYIAWQESRVGRGFFTEFLSWTPQFRIGKVPGVAASSISSQRVD